METKYQKIKNSIRKGIVPAMIGLSLLGGVYASQKYAQKYYSPIQQQTVEENEEIFGIKVRGANDKAGAKDYLDGLVAAAAASATMIGIRTLYDYLYRKEED